MEKRTVGRTDLEVTKICLGTMTWGYQNTEEEAHEQLDYAIEEAGINIIDTAEVYAVPPSEDTYGKTETYIGNWLEKRGKRDDLIIASKIAGRGRNYIRGGEGFTAEGIKAAIDGSLKRLKTDYIDIYQLHWPQRSVPVWGKLNYEEVMFDTSSEDEAHFVEILEALKEIQDAGKIKYAGLSNETPWGTMKYLHLADKYGLPRMQTIQNAYSLVRREYEIGLAEISMQEDIGLLAYSPLAGGMLSGKYLNGAKPEGARYSTWGADRMPQYQQDKVGQSVQELKDIADELGISLTQLSLAFVNDRGFVTSNIIGATTMEQLKECISSADITLSEETMDKINKQFHRNPNPSTF